MSFPQSDPGVALCAIRDTLEHLSDGQDDAHALLTEIADSLKELVSFLKDPLKLKLTVSAAPDQLASLKRQLNELTCEACKNPSPKGRLHACGKGWT